MWNWDVLRKDPLDLFIEFPRLVEAVSELSRSSFMSLSLSELLHVNINSTLDKRREAADIGCPGSE